jgi:hypothetical protein
MRHPNCNYNATEMAPGILFCNKCGWSKNIQSPLDDSVFLYDTPDTPVFWVELWQSPWPSMFHEMNFQANEPIEAQRSDALGLE